MTHWHENVRRRATRAGEDGFTLVELLVVVILVAILTAIAIPLYLTQQKKAIDAVVRSDLWAAVDVEGNPTVLPWIYPEIRSGSASAHEMSVSWCAALRYGLRDDSLGYHDVTSAHAFRYTPEYGVEAGSCRDYIVLERRAVGTAPRVVRRADPPGPESMCPCLVPPSTRTLTTSPRCSTAWRAATT